jgi:molecular chaperone HscB
MQYFSLFNLPAKFTIDARSLDTAYRAAQAQTHPDKFAAAPDAERRRAEQHSALINDAYKTLKDPVLRAAYLIKTQSAIDVFDERNTKMPVDFLVQQMEIREELAEICAVGTNERVERLEALLERVEALGTGETERLREALDDSANAQRAQEHTRKLRFLQKISTEIQDALD